MGVVFTLCRGTGETGGADGDRSRSQVRGLKRESSAELTSGKVPLEKTLEKMLANCILHARWILEIEREW
jgi:hypothetical protein